jgi:hypothetical protein
MQVELDVEEAVRAVALWIKAWNVRFDRYPSDEDVRHSALLRRLLSGKPPLDIPPPLRFSQPDYALAEGDEVEISDIHDEGDEVIIDGAKQWRRIGNDELVHTPSGQVYRLHGKNLRKRRMV